MSLSSSCPLREYLGPFWSSSLIIWSSKVLILLVFVLCSYLSSFTLAIFLCVECPPNFHPGPLKSSVVLRLGVLVLHPPGPHFPSPSFSASKCPPKFHLGPPKSSAVLQHGRLVLHSTGLSPLKSLCSVTV